MVPRVSRQGRSFTGAWTYYAHDKRTEAQREAGQSVRTRERVAFTHTENLSGIEDDRAAVGLMIDTARQSQRCEKPVYAFSLAWHPDESPEPARMIEAGRSALKALGMQDHQALFVAHRDTAHPHLHVIVNRVHPDTGKAINLYKDQEKLSAWALAYERAQGKVYCRARAFNALARQAAKEQDGRPAPRRYADNTIAECWSRSDSGKRFKAALEAKGWGLAKGDRKENVLMAVTPSGRAFAVLRELNKGLPKGQSIKAADFDRKTEDLKREGLRPVQEVQREMERRAKSRGGERVKQRSALRQGWEAEQNARQAGAAKAAFDRARPNKPQQAKEGAAPEAEQQRMQPQQELEAWEYWQRGQRVQRQEAKLTALGQRYEAESKALRERHGRETQEQEQRIAQARQAGNVPEPANDREREKLQEIFRAYSQSLEADRSRQERDRQQHHGPERSGRSRSREP